MLHITHLKTMRRTTILLPLLLIAWYAHAQQYAWSGQIASPQGSSAYSTYLSEDGSSFFIGTTTGTADLNPGPGVANVSLGSLHSYITKLAADNTYAWGFAVPGIIESVVEAPGSALYLVGRFQGSVDMNPGTGVAALGSAGGNDGFVLKVDQAGIFQWAVSIGGSGNDVVVKAALSSTGELLLAGWVEGAVDFDPGPGTSMLGTTGAGAFLWRLSPAGTYLGASVWGGGAPPGSIARNWGIAVDAQDNILLLGTFRGTVDMDPGAGTSNLTSTLPNADDIHLTKLTADGSFLWTRQFTGLIGVPSIGVKPMALDAAGNIFLGGTFTGTADLDPGPGTNSVTSAGDTDIWFLKLDPDGNHLWGLRLGGTVNEAMAGISVDGSGRLFATGSFRGTIDLDPGPGIQEYTSPLNSAYVLVLDGNGEFVYSGTFTATTVINVFASGISVNAMGDVVLTGTYFGTIDADPGPGTVLLSPIGGGSQYLIRLNAINTGLADTEQQTQRLLPYPVPAAHLLHLASTTDLHNAQLYVLDATGRTVLTRRLTGTIPTIPLDDLAEGGYLLRVVTPTGAEMVQRFVVQR
jgi:hypothetical protein